MWEEFDKKEAELNPWARDFDPGKIKAVFIDADGTLVSFMTHEVPASALEAIRRLQEKGIKVCLATGRTVAALADLAELPFDGFVCSSGQYLLNAEKKQIRSQTLDRGDIARLCDYLARRESAGEKAYDFCFLGQNESFFNHLSHSTEKLCRELAFPLFPTRPLDELREKDWLQLMFFGNRREQRDIMELMPASLATRWHEGFIDIMPRSGGKDVGLKMMAQHLGLRTEECLAVGDGDNDIPMLKTAGYAVAMGNATLNTKDAADLVTASVDRDGLAKAFRFLGLID